MLEGRGKGSWKFQGWGRHFLKLGRPGPDAGGVLIPNEYPIPWTGARGVGSTTARSVGSRTRGAVGLPLGSPAAGGVRGA